MAFIVLEGLDRSGKSTVAKYYEEQGYKVIHFSAPEKKYYQSGYTGPSYCDSVVEMLVELSGQDVVFDRSWYGELYIWPLVYGRKSLLSEDDMEIIREIEDQNSTTRILMHDPDEFAHWQRCVENKEPLNSSQFKQARQLYYAMAEKQDFQLKTKQDYEAQNKEQVQREDRGARASEDKSKPTSPIIAPINQVKSAPDSFPLSPEQIKLAQANAINEILSSRVVRKKGDYFDIIEAKIRGFLNTELGALLGTAPQPQQTQVQPQLPLSKEEIVFLKALIKNAKEKRT
jgi:hypothetical protein